MAMCIDDNIAQGMSREEADAMRAALRQSHCHARARLGRNAALGSRASGTICAALCASSSRARDLPSWWLPRWRWASAQHRHLRASRCAVAAVAAGRNPQELAQVRIVDMDKARGGFSADIRRSPISSGRNCATITRAFPELLRGATSVFPVIRAAMLGLSMASM